MQSVGEQAAEEGMDASLSPEFAGWCKARLRELRGGDDDLFLVQFLMTVASNAEVAEYLTQALGKTAAVSAFSNEFIKWVALSSKDPSSKLPLPWKFKRRAVSAFSNEFIKWAAFSNDFIK